MREYTATAYLFYEDKTLLLKHPKLTMWLPPGGHLQAGELPHEGALREVMEETNLEVKLLSQENIHIDRWNAKSIPRPYMCLCEQISHPPHEHIDFIFIAEVIKPYTLKSSFPAKWFSLKEMEMLSGDTEIFEETKEVLRHLFSEKTNANSLKMSRLSKRS